MTPLILACCIAGVLLAGCDKQRDKAPEPQPAATATIATETVTPAPTFHFLAEAIEPVLVEYPSAALPVWRRFREQRPALLLVSNNPFLVPTPAELGSGIKTLLARGTDAEIAARTYFSAPDILIQPDMTLSAALDCGLFSAVHWLYPATVPLDQIGLDKFRTQLLESGLINSADAETLSLNAGIIEGRIRGVPFRAIHPQALQPITEPVVVHVDLSFFPSLYKGEIKTPLYALITETLNMLQTASAQALAVTLSSSNLTGGLPLATRFIGPNLASLIAHPEQIGAELPPNWQRRGQALYLPNFFQNNKIQQLYLDMERDDPTDPSVKYGLYQISRELGNGNEALAYLAQAVALDPVYGYEYLDLAATATKKQLRDQSVGMLQKAATAIPGDPAIELELAELLDAAGQTEQALPIRQRLASLPWSTFYYPEMKAQLESSTGGDH